MVPPSTSSANIDPGNRKPPSHTLRELVDRHALAARDSAQIREQHIDEACIGMIAPQGSDLAAIVESTAMRRTLFKI